MNGQVNREILDTLSEILEEQDLLISREDLEPYSHDETLGMCYFPEVVVRPRNKEAVRKILFLAEEKRIPVTARGGGTGVTGGALPVFGGIVLSLEKMDKILELDMGTSMAVVQPGIINGNFQRELEKEELFYPVNPASMDSCTIGGNVAESASGANAVKYGGTRNYVCGIEAVLANGEIIRAGGKLLKNATDSQLIDLLLGSEGTLGIITEVVLRALPLPRERIDLIVPFDKLEGITQVVQQILSRKIIPTNIEYVDQATLKACQKYLQKELPFKEADSHLLIGIDGDKAEELERICQIVGEICLDGGASDVLIAKDRLERERLWKIRQSMRDALISLSPIMAEEDIVVPRNRMIALLKQVKEIMSKYSLCAACFGHLGDGNVHINILRKEMDTEEWEEKISLALLDLFNFAVASGGKISGEHGIGLVKKKYLSLGLSSSELRLMKGIKRLFDPKNVLNPGKIFDF